MIHQLPFYSIFLVAAAFIMSDEIHPIGQWKGVNPDLQLKDLCPADQLITNPTQLKKVWQAWRPRDAPPRIDFAKDVILVATARGPNQVLINGLRIENGDLKFTTGSTRMAGPGFGYTMLQIPREGIKSVNGLPVGPTKTALTESIQVTVVGRLASGVMAIGGETTGTTITANNITWELDLQDDEQLVEAVDRLGKSRARVTGTLIKKRGVEIRERMIVLVDTITAMSDESKQKVDWSIEITKSGGLAGVNEQLSIDSSGAVKNTKKQQRVTESWNLPAEKLDQLHQHLTTADWASVPPTTSAKNAADAFQYNVTLVMNADEPETYIFSIDEISLKKFPQIKQLFELIRR